MDTLAQVEVYRLGWLAGLAGWEGLMAMVLTVSRHKTLALYLEVYKLGWLAGWQAGRLAVLAGREGSAGSNDSVG